MVGTKEFFMRVDVVGPTRLNLPIYDKPVVEGDFYLGLCARTSSSFTLDFESGFLAFVE